MKRSIVLAAAALAALTLVAAGCGDSDEIPADAVAVVDGTTITRTSLDELLSRAKKSYAAQKRAFPKAGTSEYQSLQTQAVAFLVQREEYTREADDLGIEVTDAQIEKKLDEVRKQYFGDDQKKFEKGLKDQGYTVATLPRGRPLAADHRGDLRQGHERRQGHGRRRQVVLRQEPVELRRRRVACRPPHPRQDEGRGGQAPLRARLRR